jgi:hypothetical protein
VPVSVKVAGGAQEEFGVPVTVSWNVDPREVPGFRVNAYFSDQAVALLEPTIGAAIPANELMARWGDGYLPFDANGTVTLFRTAILPDLRRGQRQEMLSLKIVDSALPSVQDGTYQGVLTLEVRNY